MTKDQIDQLNKQQQQSIRAIEDNTPFELFGAPISPDRTRRDKSPKIILAEKRDGYMKRDTVIKQQVVDDVKVLPFVSSTKGYNAKSYVYLSPAGAGITVYVIDSGLDSLHNEFQGVNIQKWIFVLGSDHTYSDDPRSYHGTCMASLVTGKVSGASKKVELIPVKLAPDKASFLNALSEVVTDVKEKKDAGIEVRGYTVVNISGGFKPASTCGPTRDELEVYLKTLTETYEAVVVVAGRHDFKNPVVQPEIDTWPAAFSRTTNIITVGAVEVTDAQDNGRLYPWSAAPLWPEGRVAVTVNAPGRGKCAVGNQERRIRSGTSFSAGMMSGLVAYVLSTEDGDNMRGDDSNIPNAMRDHLVHQSYPRFGAGIRGDEAVSNGLDGDNY